MTRRDLLLLLAAAACGTPQKVRQKPQRADARTEPDVQIVDDWLEGIRTGSQLRPSPLAVRGDQIARANEDELELVDATTLTRVGYIGEHYLSVCPFGRDTLLGFVKKGAGSCEIDVIKGSTLGTPLEGRECALMDGAHLVPASPSEIYIARGETLVRYRVAQDHLREVGRIALDEGAQADANGDDQMLGTGDGRVIAPNGKTLQVLEVGKPTLTYAGAMRSIAHLALGSNGRVWYSRWNADGAIQDVALARLAAGLPADAAISVAPDRVIHMASGADGSLAMLLFDEHHIDAPWTMVYVDDNARERWRTRLDQDLMKAVDIYLNQSFVAVTATRVVLAPPRHALVAWDVATGMRIRPAS